jgi:hypothetical protein
VSTKVRFILKFKNGTQQAGPAAVAYMCKLQQRNSLSTPFPLHWDRLSKLDKLRFIAAGLPKGYKFTIYREPKWCRKNRSLYLKALKDHEYRVGGAIRPLIDNDPRLRADPNGNQAQEEFDEWLVNRGDGVLRQEVRGAGRRRNPQAPPQEGPVPNGIDLALAIEQQRRGQRGE